MEAIVKQIETIVKKQLVPFLIEKLRTENDVALDEAIVMTHVSEWFGSPKKPPQRKKITSEPAEDLQDKPILEKAELEKLTSKKLQELCKARKLCASGTKIMLQERLLATKIEEKKKSPEFISESEDESPKKVVKMKKTTKKTANDEDAKEKKPAKKRATKPKNVPVVIEKIAQEEVMTETDEHGNLFDPATGLVFNADDEVEGRKDENGKVRPLTEEDIELCKSKSLNYVCPYDLDEDEE